MPDHTFHSSGRQQSSHYHSQHFLPHRSPPDAWSPKPRLQKASTYADAPTPKSPPQQNKHIVAGLPRAATFNTSYDHLQLSSPESSPVKRRTSRDHDLSASSRDNPAKSQSQHAASPATDLSESNKPLSEANLAHASAAGRSDPTPELQPEEPPPQDDRAADDHTGALTDDASSQCSEESEEEDDEEEEYEEEPPALSRNQSYEDDASLSEDAFHAELESRWILNLSMAFRDKSNREKFFVTFAESPNKWRRVTVSIDYVNAAKNSLEASLKTLKYPRDKNAQIYEAIRNSLPTIQFYETVTNLKLETKEGRLHVHVTEDMNEIIKYPSMSVIGHLRFENTEFIRESEIEFEAHLSGFVYRVNVDGQAMIKKEIPGPDMVEEFLYEINALHKLKNAPDVIDLRGIVVDDECCRIKGLLIAYAPAGSLVDLLSDARDYKGEYSLSWAQRQKWARQVVTGLSAVHDAGFVQGDFTLSNIVIDENGDAKLIDINRRGCPLGWEPPEFLGLIESGQRLFMYIGVKSDLYQLGMVLWAMACEHDEPERQERPLEIDADKMGAPAFLKEWIDVCLKDDPQERWSARDLLDKSADITPPVDDRTQIALANGHHAANEVVGMDRQPDIEYPADIPDTELSEVSKPGLENWGRPHARSITGRDYYEDEPDEFDEDQSPPKYTPNPERRTTGHFNGRVPSMINSHQPVHQDSGLGIEEQELLHRMREQSLDADGCPLPSQPLLRGRFSHPAHQDSGFGEGMLDLGPAPQERMSASAAAATAAACNSRRKPDVLAGIGAHASGRS